jgi:hypothetical protein
MKIWKQKLKWQISLFTKNRKKTAKRSKLNWVFPFCEKYNQIKGPPLKYSIFPSEIKLLNIFLCQYYKENLPYRPYFIVFFTNWKAQFSLERVLSYSLTWQTVLVSFHCTESVLCNLYFIFILGTHNTYYQFKCVLCYWTAAGGKF